MTNKELKGLPTPFLIIFWQICRNIIATTQYVVGYLHLKNIRIISQGNHRCMHEYSWDGDVRYRVYSSQIVRVSCNDITTTQSVVGDLHLKNQNKVYLVGIW